MHLCQTSPRWAEQYAHERARLVQRLGSVTEGGLVEAIEHIGATSVPGVPAQPVIDIGMAIWPFPLEPAAQATLGDLGYHAVQQEQAATGQRMRYASGEFLLHLVDAGNQRWMDYLLLRDYLRQDEQARQLFRERKHSIAIRHAVPAAYERAKAEVLIQTLATARQWWVTDVGFSPLLAVARVLAAFPQPWYISSGWALDLFLGRVTRVHHDIDVVIPRTCQHSLHDYLTTRGWRFVTPLNGRLEPWPRQMQLPPASHQAHAHRAGEFIDCLWGDIDAEVWRYRRQPAITRAVQRMSLRTADNIPFLAPELVLLFKSKNTSGQERSKDQADFELVRKVLEPEPQDWLRSALAHTDAAHPWLASLV